MKKGLLICNAGMSSTIIAKGIEKNLNGKMSWKALGITGVDDYLSGIDEYDFIFISPQIRFMFNDIRASVKKTIPVVQILPQQYVVLKVPELTEIVKKELKI